MHILGFAGHMISLKLLDFAKAATDIFFKKAWLCSDKTLFMDIEI